MKKSKPYSGYKPNNCTYLEYGACDSHSCCKTESSENDSIFPKMCDKFITSMFCTCVFMCTCVYVCNFLCIRTQMHTHGPSPRTWQVSGTCSSCQSRTLAWSLMNSTNSKPTTGNLWPPQKFRCRHTWQKSDSFNSIFNDKIRLTSVLFWNALLTCMLSAVITVYFELWVLMIHS